jgi:hypothetical protein
MEWPPSTFSSTPIAAGLIFVVVSCDNDPISVAQAFTFASNNRNEETKLGGQATERSARTWVCCRLVRMGLDLKSRGWGKKSYCLDQTAPLLSTTARFRVEVVANGFYSTLRAEHLSFLSPLTTGPRKANPPRSMPQKNSRLAKVDSIWPPKMPWLEKRKNGRCIIGF